MKVILRLAVLAGVYRTSTVIGVPVPQPPPVEVEGGLVQGTSERGLTVYRGAVTEPRTGRM